MNKEYETGDVIALQDRWKPHAQSFLLRNFGPDLRPPDPEDPFYKQHKARGSNFSHISDQFYVDVSGRRDPKDWYRTVHVPEALVVRAGHLNLHGIRVYFVLGFTDALCYWEYHPEQYEVRYAGTIKDDEPKIKSYVALPTEYLRTIITKEDADHQSEESNEPGIHHEEAIQQAATEDA